MNSSTPRIFIAASEQNVGKTTACLGLYSLLQPFFPRIGFIKPVGQRYTEFEGKAIDEDSVLIRKTFGTETPIEAMSPITVLPEFTRQHIAGRHNRELVKRLSNAFDRATWEKDFVIIEGTGHAGVGSVFDLSNARVAKILGSKAVLVVPGGIGKPIDEAALNCALFRQENVEIVGVVMNKVLPSKIEEITECCARGFEHLGIELLAVLPQVPILAQPTLHEIRGNITGAIVSGPGGEWNRVSHVVIGAMTSANLLQHLRPGTLILLPGDREDLILAALAESNAGTSFSGLVLTDNLMPHTRIIHLLQESRVPTIQSPLDAYSIASRIHSMTVKTLPGDEQKISTIQELFAANFRISRLLEKLGIFPTLQPVVEDSSPDRASA